MEVCPSCGNFVSSLDDVNGWCSVCSVDATHLHHPSFCTSCGGVIKRAARKCDKCKQETFISNYADAVEEILLEKNCSLTKAIQEVRDLIRPKCVVCKEPIKGAHSGAVFCRQRSECRRASRSYVYYYREKGLSKKAALEIVLSNLK